MRLYLFFILILCTRFTFAQDLEPRLSQYDDSTHYKLVFRTEQYNGDRFIQLDNLTARVNGDTTKLFYTRYGDMMISSLMIPYNIFEKFLTLEASIFSGKCPEANDCEYSLLITTGTYEQRIPIDEFHTELLSTFMLNEEP